MFYNTLTAEERKDLREMDKEIARAKRRLSKEEVYENFGQTEVRIIEMRYAHLTYECGGRNAFFERIDRFKNWCMNYTG